MSQSSTSRRRTTRRRRRASRIGSPAVRSVREARRRSMRSPRRAALRAARAAPRRRQLQTLHQPVELRKLPGASASKRLERSTSSSLAATATATSRRSSESSSPGDGRGVRRPPPRRPPFADLAGGRLLWRPSPRRSVRPARVAGGPRSEHRREHRVEGLDLGLVGDQHPAGRPVEAPPRDRLDQPSAGANRAARSAVVGTPASFSRRLKAPVTAGRSRWIVRTVKA